MRPPIPQRMAGVPDDWVWRTPWNPDYGKYGVDLPRPLHVYFRDRQTGQVAKFVNFVPPGKKPPPVLKMPVEMPALPKPKPKADP